MVAALDYKKVISEVISDFGISNKEFAKIVGVSPSTVSRWLSGTCPSPVFRERLSGVLRMDEKLRELFEEGAISGWLHEPLEFLDGDTPLDAIKKGKCEKIYQLFAYIDGEVFL